MGYTHYWTYKRDGDQREWANAIATASRVLDATDCPLDLTFGDDAFYVNGTGPCDGGRNHCDGQEGYGCKGDDGAAHETFVLYTVLSELPPSPSYSQHGPNEFWDFCKTAQKSYDVPVSAMLAIVAHLAPSCIEVRSDGDRENWQPGLDLAASILGYPVDLPFPERIAA